MLIKSRLAGTINCGAILRHLILDATLVSARIRPKNICRRFQHNLTIIIIPVCVFTLAIAAFLASGVKKRVIAKTASLTELLLFNIK